MKESEAVPTESSSKAESIHGHFCSWCLNRTIHEPVPGARWRRNHYRCSDSECGKATVPCMVPRCQHMSRGPNAERDEGRRAKSKFFCAEHSGEVASFEWLAMRLPNANSTKYANAASLGVDPRDVKTYKILNLPSSTEDHLSHIERLIRFLRPLVPLRFRDCDNVMFINGFLTQNDVGFDDWLCGAQRLWPRTRRYGVVWESKSLTKLGGALLLAGGLTNTAVKLLLKSTALLPGGQSGLILAQLANLWRTTKVRSQLVGEVNANLLCRVEGQTTSLMGHSLGARAIYYTLQNLSRFGGAKPTNRVRDVFLFGGAVDRNDEEGWKKAAAEVTGYVYNFYSKRDLVLKLLYSPASGFLETPIGLGPIDCGASNVVNICCSDLIVGIRGHLNYKPNLDVLLARALASRA